jgi:hypothetical protein
MVFADQQFDIAPPKGRTDESPVFFRKLANRRLVQAGQHFALTIVPFRPWINYGG